MKHRDKIEIRGLWIQSRVGVLDEERAKTQKLSVDLIIYPIVPLQGLSDDITRTVDYDRVATAVRDAAEEGTRRLIETLAEDIAGVVLGFGGVEKVEVELKKYVLPNTDYVSVTVCRNRDEE